MTDKTKVAGKAKSKADLSTLPSEYTAISPLDGRYHQIGETLAPYFSEYALMENRVKVEIHWLKYLLENIKDSDILVNFDMDRLPDVMGIYENFGTKGFSRIKEIEAKTNHDVKSVELYIAEQLKDIGLENLVSYVHIGCTSEDINNTAYARMITDAMNEVIAPAAKRLENQIIELAKPHIETPMLAHTHGQPATPTTVGRELMVHTERLHNAMKKAKNTVMRAKFNGATGNYAAISVAFPGEDWESHSKRFIEEYLGLKFNPITTQIENHDSMSHISDAISHYDFVLEGLDWDMWTYISMEYFKQIPVKTEVGSSTMPHKVNPIRFENSAANADMSAATLKELAMRLANSRMQRDLSDSSRQRNFGIAFGYTLQAIEQTIGGLKKVAVNEDKLAEDLNEKWEVLAEPVQTVLRKYGILDAYNQLKELTRGKNITKEALHEFINSLDVLSDKDRNYLLALTPASYYGYAPKIARDSIKRITEDAFENE